MLEKLNFIFDGIKNSATVLGNLVSGSDSIVVETAQKVLAPAGGLNDTAYVVIRALGITTCMILVGTAVTYWLPNNHRRPEGNISISDGPPIEDDVEEEQSEVSIGPSDGNSSAPEGPPSEKLPVAEATMDSPSKPLESGKIETTHFILGSIDSILSTLHEECHLPRTHKVKARVIEYLIELKEALLIEIEYATHKGKSRITINDSLLPTESRYPFDFLREYIEKVVQEISPGSKLSFGLEQKIAKFLGKEFSYHSLTIDLGTPLARIQHSEFDLISRMESGGTTTSHFRYPQMYMDAEKRLQKIPNPRALILGPGLSHDPLPRQDSVQCPQLYEVAALCNRGTVDVLEVDPTVATILHNNIKKTPNYKPRMRCDGNALSRQILDYNNFSQPEEIAKFIDNMRPHMNVFASKLHNANIIQGDLCQSLATRPNAPRYDLIFSTNSMSNVFQRMDKDPAETKQMVDILTNYMKFLKPNGVLYLDQRVFMILEERLGENCIEETIKPALEYATQSEVTITLLECAVPTQYGQGWIVVPLSNGQSGVDVHPVSTHNVYSLHRGVDKKNCSGDFIQHLIAHYRQSAQY